MRPEPEATRAGERLTVRWPGEPGEARGPVVAAAPLDWSPPAAQLALLTAAEREHHASFPAGPRRREYAAGHALLHALGQERGEATDFRRHADGRPELHVAGAARAASLSHAGGFVAAGFTAWGSIGIDLELPRAERAWRAAERRSGWPALGPRERLLRWSLWEAAGKARGLSVFRPGPDPVFEALWDPDRGALRADGPGCEGRGWRAWRWPIAGDGVLVVVLGEP